VASSQEFFIQLASGEYIWGLFHDVTPATFRQIHQLLRESVEAIPKEAAKNLNESNGKDITVIKQRITDAGKMALLDNPEDACRLFSLSYNACNGTESADRVYEKLCNGFLPKNTDKLTTGVAHKMANSLRTARFCFLCTALVWEHQRKNTHHSGGKHVK